jgi:hypothetical protein
MSHRYSPKFQISVWRHIQFTTYSICDLEEGEARAIRKACVQPQLAGGVPQKMIPHAADDLTLGQSYAA